jgi:hypothetical protein
MDDRSTHNVKTSIAVKDTPEISETAYLLQNPSDWLYDAPWLNCSRSDTREQWRKRKVVPGRYDLHIIQSGIEIPQERGATPTSPKHHDFLPRRKLRLLHSSI